ncbi:MAG: PspC domain-containing protein, partial [Flavobacteriales bacterium]
MKKTITVNIGGYAFTIEEDAYQSLLTYLKTIESFFQIEEGGDEILSDIEARIAELFNERLGEGRQVVEEEDVVEIKLIMGEPEQYAPFDTEEPEPASESADHKKYERSKNRKFYRDTEDELIGGVCSGLSHYLGWDPIWLRGIFIGTVIAGFAGIPLYIILWIL